MFCVTGRHPSGNIHAMNRPHIASKPWTMDFLALSAIWGASFLFMRLAVVDFGTLPTAALRAGIGALALLPLLLWQGRCMQVARHWKALFAAGVLSAAIPTGCLSFALLSISTGLTAIINATAPLFGALLAFLWLGHKPRRLAVVGLALGFGGVAMLVWAKASFNADAEGWAAALAMLSASVAALSGAFSALFARRYLGSVPPVVLATGSQAGAALGLAGPAFFSWPQHSAGPQAWLAVAASGVLCTGVGYLLFFRVLERAGPTRAMTVTFVMPLFAMAYGIAFLQEQVTAAMVGCAALIIVGTTMSMQRLGASTS
ncbi:MAG: protein of unknown function transrane [Variovorax sp.]|nr:protein of unknown function transrane [Variovorax sp.]